MVAFWKHRQKKYWKILEFDESYNINEWWQKLVFQKQL